ncbi:putative lrr receptor-like serine/threonine-protein kinase [Quercus suber]|uniref:Lrr receptor-like serine/threonine-protein kinase n=1 Tax=Quercus suber TaxID=58331 RepID=A0AAW0KSV5_QUESU
MALTNLFCGRSWANWTMALTNLFCGRSWAKYFSDCAPAQVLSKVDVFGFGFVALEIISGRPNFDPNLGGEEKKYLLEWV